MSFRTDGFMHVIRQKEERLEDRLSDGVMSQQG